MQIHSRKMNYKKATGRFWNLVAFSCRFLVMRGEGDYHLELSKKKDPSFRRLDPEQHGVLTFYFFKITGQLGSRLVGISLWSGGG